MISKQTVVMVVDDFEAMRQVISTQLRSLGVDKIVTANNGAEALRILQTQHVDILLSDWNMPVMSGLDLLKAIRSDEQLYSLPFIMITAEAEHERIEEAIACGVSGLLVKPYTIEGLATRVDKALTWKPRRISAAAAPQVVATVTPATLAIASPTPVPKEAHRPTILVVDDTSDNLLLLAQLFKDEYRVRIANNGEKALDICCSDSPPDLVLLDIMMPGMDGFEVARRMREHPSAETIPVIFVTAMTGEDARLKGLELGAVDFITKPIDPEVLKPRVRNFMRYVELHKQLQADYDGMLEAAQLREDVEHITRHDMKGPLAGVIGLVQELADDDSMSRKQTEQLRMVEETALQVLNMTNLSSELFKIETGRFKLDAKPVKIGDILQRIVEISRATFAEKHVTISIDTDVPVPYALGDAMLCYSLFQNLIKNACEAAPEKSQVSVTLHDQEPLRIVIENKGTVPVEIRERFFDKFVTKGKQGGTGLGTYSAKLLSEAQGGHIELDVSDETNTTTIIVLLPRTTSRGPEVLKVPKDEGTGRIEAFSDGVFAIAITLLVLEIKVPGHTEVEQQGLAHLLVALWPSYLAFITSFITILVIWVKHHWMFTLIKRTDPTFLYRNGLLLFFITFLPFPTALLAEYLLHPEAKVAANLYTGTVFAISLAFKGLWWHATKDKMLLAVHATSAARTGAKQLTQQDQYGPPLYLLAFGVSFFSEGASIAICLLLTLFFASRDWLTKG